MNSRWWLQHLVKLGELEEAVPGVFTLPGRRAGPSQIALALVSHSILGLASALWAHGLLADEPVPVHLVIPHGGHASRQRKVPVRLWRSREFCEGKICGGYRQDLVALPIERTLVDCLRYRCGIPLERIEAVTLETLATQRTTVGGLIDAADSVALRGQRRQFIEAVIERWRRAAANR